MENLSRKIPCIKNLLRKILFGQIPCMENLYRKIPNMKNLLRKIICTKIFRLKISIGKFPVESFRVGKSSAGKLSIGKFYAENFPTMHSVFKFILMPSFLLNGHFVSKEKRRR